MVDINIGKEIEILKAEAAKLLDNLAGIQEPYATGASKRIVECIISAAILEVAKLNSEALGGLNGKI